MILQLTKQSTDQEIKAYFEEVLRMSRDSEEFPVNLDDVWPLVYSRKDKAVRALKEGELFIEGIDYIPLPQKGERLEGNLLAQNGKRMANGQFNGCDKVTYKLSVPALSSSSPARFAQCSRSTAKCFTRWQAVNCRCVCLTAYQATPRARWHRWRSSTPTSWRDTPAW